MDAEQFLEDHESVFDKLGDHETAKIAAGLMNDGGTLSDGIRVFVQSLHGEIAWRLWIRLQARLIHDQRIARGL